MTSFNNLPPAHHSETSESSEASDLDSELFGLGISSHDPPPEDGLHGSRFIECMDYPINLCATGVCNKKLPSKNFSPLNSLAPSSVPSSPPSRRASIRFGSLVRMLSLRSASKRDTSPNSVSTTSTQMKPSSSNRNSINSAKLGRRTSQKNHRISSPLLIETTKSASWSTGLKNKTFTPSFLLSSSPSPVSLSSSTTGFSAGSLVASSPRPKSYLLSGSLLRTSKAKRRSSTTDIHHPLLASSLSDSSNDFNPNLEIPNRSSFTLKRIVSLRRGRN